MDIMEYFSYESSEIPIEIVMELTETDLDNLYAQCNEIEAINVFFHLQNEYIYLKEQNSKKELAYICYLISYYIFTALTPPHSEHIAEDYAKKALYYFNDEKYNNWLKIVSQGN
ncbi:hypothetical protein [Candidatus Galacturonibacter soehngenii]|uniref:Uncharacterized protein n=1 Tax=Candidatus Galacturonatibacter soehngenii TaxID=2307010 RepID=A0A7V7UBH7_9FIRM|nr:hypothetical protein [Candidatus Galacturonibacter soehngenii]KAB1437975.1 hypothetical protein F7O84_10345 [Candidatus Galacturonibacter soehngenii]